MREVRRIIASTNVAGESYFVNDEKVQAKLPPLIFPASNGFRFGVFTWPLAARLPVRAV